MKLKQTNSDQLDIYESGRGGLVVAAIFLAGGLGLAIWVLVNLNSTPWWVALIGLGVAGIGVLAGFSAASRTVTLRRSGASEITERKLITKKVTSRQFDASQVAAVGLETHIEVSTQQSDKGSTTKRERVSILYITLTDSTEVVLARKRSGANGLTLGSANLSSFGAAPLATEAKQIADLYGVQLQSRTDGAMGGVESIASVVGTIKQAIGSAQSTTPGADLSTQSPVLGNTEMASFSAPQVQSVAPQVVTNVMQPQVVVAAAQVPVIAAVEQPVTYQPQQPAAPYIDQSAANTYQASAVPGSSVEATSER